MFSVDGLLAEATASGRKMDSPPPWPSDGRTAFNGPPSFGSSCVHVGALAAPFVFTWKGLLLFLVLSWLTGGLGVCLGYHRLMAHLSFQTYPIVRRVLGLLGALAGQGPPITWIGVHRKHHQYTDIPGDPHSPREGAWWSHVLWLFPRPREPQWTKMIRRYSKDLLQDPFMRSARQDLPGVAHRPGRRSACRRMAGLGALHGLVLSRLRHVPAAGVGDAHHLGGQFGVAHVGLPRTTTRPTTAATCGGSDCWPTAKAGTTTITPFPIVPGMGTAGGKST